MALRHRHDRGTRLGHGTARITPRNRERIAWLRQPGQRHGPGVLRQFRTDVSSCHGQGPIDGRPPERARQPARLCYLATAAWLLRGYFGGAARARVELARAIVEVVEVGGQGGAGEILAGYAHERSREVRRADGRGL